MQGVMDCKLGNSQCFQREQVSTQTVCLQPYVTDTVKALRKHRKGLRIDISV